MLIRCYCTCSGSDSTEALAALSWVCAAMRVGYKDGETMKGNDFNQLVIKSIISFKIIYVQSYQINMLATNFLRLLDLQMVQISEMESSINHLSQVIYMYYYLYSNL